MLGVSYLIGFILSGQKLSHQNVSVFRSLWVLLSVSILYYFLKLSLWATPAKFLGKQWNRSCRNPTHSVLQNAILTCKVVLATPGLKKLVSNTFLQHPISIHYQYTCFASTVVLHWYRLVKEPWPFSIGNAFQEPGEYSETALI